MHIILALLVSTANAGWFTRLCEGLVMDDPDQHAAMTDDYLERAMRPLEIRERWGTITPLELHVLDGLRREQRRRDQYPVLRVPN